VLGTKVAFGSEVDEIVFPSGAAEFPLVDADPHLNKILIQVGEEALKARKRAVGTNNVPYSQAVCAMPDTASWSRPSAERNAVKSVLSKVKPERWFWNSANEPASAGPDRSLVRNTV